MWDGWGLNTWSQGLVGYTRHYGIVLMRSQTHNAVLHKEANPKKNSSLWHRKWRVGTIEFIDGASQV